LLLQFTNYQRLLGGFFYFRGYDKVELIKYTITMFSKYTFWLKAASAFQLLTGLIHSLSLFIEMKGKNETENRMLELMTSHKMDMGAGIFHSMMDLLLALSSCFTFLYLLGGINNFYLINRMDTKTIRGYLLINLIVFGMCFFVMLFLTFLPPIILTGIVFVLLFASYITSPKSI
jgi:hypothetical protein